MAENGPFGTPFLTPKIPPKKFMWVLFLRSFPGNEAHKLFSRGPKWGVSGGVLKVYVEKVYVLFPPLIRALLGKVPGKSLEKITRIAKCYKFWDFGHWERQTCREPWVDTAWTLSPPSVRDAFLKSTVPAFSSSSDK